MKSCTYGILLALTLVVGAFAQSVPLVGWGLYGNSGNELSISPAESAQHIVGLNIVRGAGLVTEFTTHSFAASGWEDLASDDYMSFGLTVEDGHTARIDSIRLSYGVGVTGPKSFIIKSSLDGFTSPVFMANLSPSAYNNVEVTLAGLVEGFDAVTGTVEFRIMTNSTEAASIPRVVDSSGVLRIRGWDTLVLLEDSRMTIQGYVVGSTQTSVPEPGSFAFVSGLATMGLAATRRKRNP